MTAIPSYAVGTVSVAANDTIVVGAGGPLWAQTANAMAGDDIVVAGHTVVVQDVTDDNHLVIDPWPYADVAAGAKYKIVQRSPLRYSGGTAMAIVMQLLAGLNTAGLSIIVPPGAAAPDPSLGEENQFAIQPSTFKLWLKIGGAWIFQGLYKGLRIRGEWNAADTFEPNDVVSRDGSSYAALTESTNQAPPNATYWMLLAAKGAPGQDGRDGDVGPTGPGYLATSTSPLEIRIGSKTFATQEGLAYTVGARARASSNANGANYMEGLVTAYAGGDLTINVSKVSGAGTFADWNINVAGEPGSGDMLSSNNLSDVSSRIAAIDNLSTKGADIVAGATLNLESATGNFVHVTGTTNITAITLGDGHQRTVLFAGALTITASASLVLQNDAASLAVEAGAIGVFIGDGSIVRLTDYVPTSQLAVANINGTVSTVGTQALTAAQQVQARVNILAASRLRTRTIILGGSGTYTPPAGCVAIFVRMVGGGAGGGGGSSSAANAAGGGPGGTTTFGGLNATGGNPSGGSGGGISGGGAASGGDYNQGGGAGGFSLGGGAGSQSYPFGHDGASSPFGPGGLGNFPANPNGQVGGTGGGPGSGGGGGGGFSSGGFGGTGGSGGGYLEKLILNPVPTPFAIGAGGLGGSAGNNGGNGGPGAPGAIFIEEYY